MNISYPLIHTYVCISGGKKCSFFGKFGVFCLLETPDLRFTLLPYYRRILRILISIVLLMFMLLIHINLQDLAVQRFVSKTMRFQKIYEVLQLRLKNLPYELKYR